MRYRKLDISPEEGSCTFGTNTLILIPLCLSGKYAAGKTIGNVLNVWVASVGELPAGEIAG
jgi:hypothetical protein